MSVKYIVDYVLEKADYEPCCIRAKIYSELADMVPDKESAAELLEISRKLKNIESDSCQLRLKLSPTPKL